MTRTGPVTGSFQNPVLNGLSMGSSDPGVPCHRGRPTWMERSVGMSSRPGRPYAALRMRSDAAHRHQLLRVVSGASDGPSAPAPFDSTAV